MFATWFYPSDQGPNDLHSVQEYVAVRYNGRTQLHHPRGSVRIQTNPTSYTICQRGYSVSTSQWMISIKSKI